MQLLYAPIDQGGPRPRSGLDSTPGTPEDLLMSSKSPVVPPAETVVVAPPQAPAPASALVLADVPSPDAPGTGVLTNLADAKAIYSALTGDAPALGDFIGKEFPLSGYVIHPTETVDSETGEVLNLERVVLIGPKGEMLGCVSDGIRRCVMGLVAVFGPGPWTTPLPVVVRQKNTRAGRRFYTLELQ